MIAKLIYILCGLTSAACAGLLLRGYLRNSKRLLLLSALCFFLLTLSNIGVYLDLVVLSEIDFAESRALLTLIGMMVLLLGMIFETK